MDHVGEQPATREPLETYQALAQMIDHSLVRPELSEDQVRAGCLLAADYGVATVTVRPSDIDQAVRYLRGSATRPASVAGFPHGDSNTATKLYEARDLIRRGASEIDMVINIGKLISRQFPYVETELVQMANACRSEGVLLKVIFENAYLTEDLKIIACKIAKRAEVDFVKTSTGFAPSGCTLEDVRLMYGKCNPRVKVKAAAGVRSLETALAAYQAGADRFGCTATAVILEAWKAQLAKKAESAESIPPAPAGPTP
ncbi:MAG: deoxyribose-phosphate aldolase [Acidobacteriia bacterium]|nr:deoxyribose-phosphate aldolase [Terriglobia bacterium]